MVSDLSLLGIGLGTPCVPFLSSSYAAAVLALTPKTYHQMQDCNGNPVDSSGNGFTFTNTNTFLQYRQPGALTDPLDKALFTVGNNGALGTASLPTAVRDNCSMFGWANVQSVTQNNQVVYYLGSSGPNGWGMVISTDLKVQILLGGVAFLAKSTTALTASTWAHIGIVRNAGSWTYYLNGNPNGSPGATTPNIPTVNLFMAAVSLQWYFSHWALFETALSAAQVAALYAAR